MATVTGLTADRMQELVDAYVVSGYVNPIGNLILVTYDGTEMDAGAVMDPLLPGTSGQYYRGDKTWQTLDKTAVGLINVDNTSDANKPVSTAQATAINLKKWAEYTGPSVSSPAGNGVNFGQMTIDNTKGPFNNTFVQPAGTTGLQILETGIYAVVSNAFPVGSGGNVHSWATRSGSVSDTPMSRNHISYGSNSITDTEIIYCLANDIIQLGLTTSNTVNVSSRIKVGKLMG